MSDWQIVLVAVAVAAACLAIAIPVSVVAVYGLFDRMIEREWKCGSPKNGEDDT